MKILLVAAVEFEIRPLLDGGLPKNVSTLITGAGIPATAYGLTKALGKAKPDLILNAGLAGSFNPDLAPGTAVLVSEDCFGDLGAEDGEEFLPLDELEFEKSNPTCERWMPAGNVPFAGETLKAMKQVRAVTVNMVHGEEKSIDRIRNRFQPDIETMEGAAVFYVARREGVPAIQVRCISNLVERRDLRRWKTDLAVSLLNEAVRKILEEILRA